MSSLSLIELEWVELDKDNVARGTTTGQFLLCRTAAKASASDSDFTKGDFEVYDSQANVEARAKHLADYANGAAVVARDCASETGFVKEFLGLKRSDLHYMVNNWKKLCGAGPAPMLPADPLLGMTFRASLPFAAVSSFVLEVCDCSVDSVGSAPDTFNVKATKQSDGSIHDFALAKAMITSWAATTPAPAVFQVDWDTATYGTFLFGLVKKLPLSSGCGGGKVEAKELLAIGQILAPATCSSLAFNTTAPFVPTAADGMVVSLVLASLVSISSSLDVDAVAKARSWPEDSPTRLATAIKAYRSAGSAGPPQHPLVAQLEAKAVDAAAFDAFLDRSYQLTLPADRHAWASGASRYVLRGALDKFLASAGRLTSDISALAGGMDQGRLEEYLDMCKDDELARKSSLPSIANANATAIANANPLNLSTPFGAGTSQLLVLKDADAKQSAQESRELTQLRLDAQTIAGDAGMTLQLNAMIALKNNMQIDLLTSAIQALKEPVLIRLVQYDGNLRAALQGQFPGLVSECESLRDVLEAKLIQAVLGTSMTFVADRVERAFRHARLGRLSKCRLFHLIDEEDNGTVELPLKQLASVKEVEGKVSLVCIALSRLTAVLQISFPSQQATVTTFIPKLQGKLVSLIRVPVDLKAINQWLRVILHLMSRPIRKLAIADASVGLEMRLAYDDEWLGLEKGHNDELQKSLLLAHSAASGPAVAAAATTGGAREGSAKQQKRIQELERQLSAAKKPKTVPPAATPGAGGKKNTSLSKYEWAGKAEKLTPDSDGKYPKMVGAGHALLLQWNKDNPKTSNTDNKPVCWAHSNFMSGCPMTACKYFHLD